MIASSGWLTGLTDVGGGLVGLKGSGPSVRPRPTCCAGHAADWIWPGDQSHCTTLPHNHALQSCPTITPRTASPRAGKLAFVVSYADTAAMIGKPMPSRAPGSDFIWPFAGRHGTMAA